MLECYNEHNFNKYKTHFIFGYLTKYMVNPKNGVIKYKKRDWGDLTGLTPKFIPPILYSYGIW